MLGALLGLFLGCAAAPTDLEPRHDSAARGEPPPASTSTQAPVPSATPAPLPWANEAEHAALLGIVRPIVEPNVGPAGLRAGIPGVGVGIVRGGKYYFFGFGEARRGVPVTRTTVFEIGSITKTFVGLVLADEVLRGRVDLDAPANTILPAKLRLPSRNGKEITLRHLATHRSGLPSFVPGFGVPGGLLFMVGHGDASRADLEKWLPTVKLDQDPGDVGSYSNVGAALLGLALEAREGRPWTDLVRDVVTTPLGMSSTSAGSAPDKATGFDLFARDSTEDGLRADGAYGPAGALASNIEDMLRYATLHARAAPTPVDAQLRLAQQRHGPALADIGGAELGLFIGREGEGDPPSIAEHSGATNAFICDLHAAPKEGLATVILTNRYLMMKQGDATMIPAVDMNKAIFVALRALK